MLRVYEAFLIKKRRQRGSTLDMGQVSLHLPYFGILTFHPVSFFP